MEINLIYFTAATYNYFLLLNILLIIFLSIYKIVKKFDHKFPELKSTSSRWLFWPTVQNTKIFSLLSSKTKK